MAPKDVQKTKEKVEGATPKTGNKRSSADEAVPEAEDAPSPPKRRPIEETLAEDIPTGDLPSDWKTGAMSFANKAPLLRESIIREVNQYTRTLVTESELRILDAIKVLVAPLTTPQAATATPQAAGVEDGSGATEKDNAQDVRASTGSAPTSEEENKDAEQTGQGEPEAPAAEGKPIPEAKEGDAKTDAEPEAEKVHPNAFDYPQITANETAWPAAIRLRKYWSFHRANIGQQNFRAISSHQQIQDDFVFDAINCVAQAWARQNDQNAFGVWTAQASTYYIDHITLPGMGFDDTSSYVVGRPGADNLIIPFFISDEYVIGQPHGKKQHTILLHCARSTSSKRKVVIYDSASHIYEKNAQRIADWERIITRTLRDIGWMAPLDSIEFKYYKKPRQIPGSMSCGLWTILNGWIAVMGLQICTEFPLHQFGMTDFNKKQWMNSFYGEAVRMINLALCGHLDSAAIYYWLLARDYIRPYVQQDDETKIDQSYSSPSVRKFDRTWAVHSRETFEDLRTYPAATHPEIPSQRPDHNHTPSTIEPQAQAAPQALQGLTNDPNTAHLYFFSKADGLEFSSLTSAEHQRRRNLNTAS